MDNLLLLVVGTWVFIVVAMAVILWKFQVLDRRCQVVWDFLMARARVVAVREGWGTMKDTKPSQPVDTTIGFVATEMMGAKLEDTKKEDLKG